MIEIDKLTESDKGRPVRYSRFRHREYGRITSWNETYVFVRYYEKHISDAQGNVEVIPRYGETSEATSPNDLEFA